MYNFDDRTKEIKNDLFIACDEGDMSRYYEINNRLTALKFAERCVITNSDVEFSLDDAGLDRLYKWMRENEELEVAIWEK